MDLYWRKPFGLMEMLQVAAFGGFVRQKAHWWHPHAPKELRMATMLEF